MRVASHFAITFCLILSSALSGNGQAAKSELTGEVRDQNGALVPQAKLTLIEITTGQTMNYRRWHLHHH